MCRSTSATSRRSCASSASSPTCVLLRYGRSHERERRACKFFGTRSRLTLLSPLRACAHVIQGTHTTIQVTRGQLFERSFDQVSRHRAEDLRRRLFIKFEGEDGLDYGGVARYAAPPLRTP